MRAKILEEELLTLKNEGVQKVGADPDKQNLYEKEITLGIEKDMKQKLLETNSLIEVAQKKDRLIEDLENSLLEESQLAKQEDFLLEEKARQILQKVGVQLPFIRLARGLFKLGAQLMVYLRFK